jgi:hypothetical protein
VRRDEAVDELLTPLYSHMEKVDLASLTPLPLTPHQISALLSVTRVSLLELVRC